MDQSTYQPANDFMNENGDEVVVFVDDWSRVQDGASIGQPQYLIQPHQPAHQPQGDIRVGRPSFQRPQCEPHTFPSFPLR